MIGNILGAMEVTGLLGMMVHYFGEPLPLWGFYLSLGFIIIPILIVMMFYFTEEKK